MKITRKKKKNRRGEYPGLDPSKHPKTRAEALECDYIDKLTEEEKKWLSDFNEEFVGASFSKNKKERIHPVKSGVVKTRKGTKVKSKDKYKKECRDNNNARNHDLYARIRTNNLEFGEIKHISQEVDIHTEDNMVELLDLKLKNS